MSLALLRTLLIKDPLIVLATVLMGSLSLIVSIHDPAGDRQLAMARTWAKMLLKIMGIRVTVEGAEKVDSQKNYIFVCNHLSYADTPVILANVPCRFRFMAKQELFQIPFLGHHLTTAGHVSVNFENPREIVRTLTAAARQIREKNLSILIFPEGGRTQGALEPFREGAAFIAIKAGIPIVPMGLIGTRRIVPIHGTTIRGGAVRLIISDPVPTEGLKAGDRERLSLELRERVAALIGATPPSYIQQQV